MTIKLALAALMMTAPMAGIVAITTPAAAATMNCSVPNAVKCTIRSAKGIKSVKIQSNTGQGTINVVNQSYNNCPRRVTVSWDSAYSASNHQIKECLSGITIKPTGSGGLKLKNSLKTR